MLLRDALHIVKVIPVYKLKAEYEFVNYRPIPLLPSIKNILGTVVHRRTYDFNKKKNIWNNNKYGFREKHSTINAMTALTSDVINALERKLSP